MARTILVVNKRPVWAGSIESAQQIATDVNGADVNQREYRENGLASFDDAGTIHQATAYWATGTPTYLIVGVKTVADGLDGWTWYTCDGTGTTPDIQRSVSDDHAVICLAFDPDGYLHMTYDHHNDALNYRVSSNPIGTFDGGFSAESSMLGTNESSVSYSTFVNAPDGTLYHLHRSGNASAGDIYMYAYDEGTTSWGAATGTGTAGLLIDNGTEDAPYFYAPAFDADFGSGGYMHIGWHWRGDGADGDSNHDVSYARWDGTNWEQSDGSSQTVPITPSNSEVASAVAQANGLGGHGSQIDSDDAGNPHIVYPANDGSGFVQIYHAYHNGTSWSVSAITSQSTIASTGDPPPGATNGWTAPCIAVDQGDGTLYVFYAGYNQTGIWMRASDDYGTSWSQRQLWPDDEGDYAVTYDPIRWRSASAISIPIFDNRDNDAHLLEYTPA